MIIEQKVTHIDLLSEEEKTSRCLEKALIESSQLLKRIQRLSTNHGREFGIRLREQEQLTDGDVLYLDEKTIIMLEVLPDDLLVIQPKTMHQMGEVSHLIGNRHLPAQFENDEIYIQYDYLMEELLNTLNVPYFRDKRKVKQAFRHIGHSHD